MYSYEGTCDFEFLLIVTKSVMVISVYLNRYQLNGYVANSAHPDRAEFGDTPFLSYIKQQGMLNIILWHVSGSRVCAS